MATQQQEKMLNIISHYENTNQNHAEITLEDGYDEKKNKNKLGLGRMWTEWSPQICCWG